MAISLYSTVLYKVYMMFSANRSDLNMLVFTRMPHTKYLISKNIANTWTKVKK